MPTRLSDVIVPAVFTPYLMQRTLQLSALYRSGIIQADPQLNALVQGPAHTYNMPYWTDLKGRSNASTDDPAQKSVPKKIGTDKDVARKHFRNDSWSAMDLVNALAGSDPMKAIADQLADYWVGDGQTTLILQLAGVIASNEANDDGDMVIDVSSDSAGAIVASEKIGTDVFLAAKQTMGDAGKNLSVVVMHSALHTELQRQNLVPNIPNSAQDIGWGVYLGKYTVVVDDGCPVTMGANRPTYTSFLFGPGAVGYGQGTPDVPTETGRDPAAGNGSGQSILYNRVEYIMHPRGVKWTSVNDSAVTPTDAQMSDPDNWERVYDRKAIKFVAIRTNG